MRSDRPMAQRFYLHVADDVGGDEDDIPSATALIDDPVLDYLKDVIVDMGEERVIEHRGEEYVIDPGTICYSGEGTFYNKDRLEVSDLTGVDRTGWGDDESTTLMNIHGLDVDEFVKRDIAMEDLRGLLEDLKSGYDEVKEDLGHEEDKIEVKGEEDEEKAYRFFMDGEEFEEFASQALENTRKVT